MVGRKLDFGDASEESASYTDTSNHSTPNISPLSSPINSPRMRRVGDSAYVFTSVPCSPVAPRTSSHLTLSTPPLPRKKPAQLHLPMASVQSQDSLAGLLSPGRAPTNSGRLERLFSRFRNKSSTVARRASKKSPKLPRAVSDEQLDHHMQPEETIHDDADGEEPGRPTWTRSATTSFLPVPTSFSFSPIAHHHQAGSGGEVLSGRSSLMALPRSNRGFVASQSHHLSLPPAIAAYGRRGSGSTDLIGLLPMQSPPQLISPLSSGVVPTAPIASTSLAYESMFGDLAIKAVFHKASLAEGLDVSLLRVNERKLDFSLVVHQLEAMHQFQSRGVAIELWYVDDDGDQLRITDTPGLVYACQDWRAQLHKTGRDRQSKQGVCRSLCLYINETG
jgi:hypothetical protein